MTKREMAEMLTTDRGAYFRQLLRKTKAELLKRLEEVTDPRTPEQKQADVEDSYRKTLVRQAEMMQRFEALTAIGDHARAASVFSAGFRGRSRKVRRTRR